MHSLHFFQSTKKPLMTWDLSRTHRRGLAGKSRICSPVSQSLGSGWPDCAKILPMVDCLLWAVFRKLRKTFGLLFCTIKVTHYIILTKINWAPLWANFFTNSSGHPVRACGFFLDLNWSRKCRLFYSIHHAFFNFFIHFLTARRIFSYVLHAGPKKVRQTFSKLLKRQSFPS
jgi:hypothetical protein